MPAIPLLACRLKDASLLAVLFAVALYFNTSNNGFTIRYHPDEHSKVQQVRNLEFNFNHPHLLLTVTRGINAVRGPDRQAIEEANATRGGNAELNGRILLHGRWASALMAALACVCLAWGVGMHYGRLAAGAGGLMVALNHGLITRAHYMKEDPALVLGLAVAFLGLCWLWRRRGWRAIGPAIVTGIGCGLAAAGKYVGAVPALAVLPLIVAGPFFGSMWARVRGTQLVLIVAVLTFAAANFDGLAVGVNPFKPMMLGLDREITHVTTEHTGLISDSQGRYYFDVFMLETTAPARLGMGLFLLWLVMKRRATAIDMVLLLFPLGYAAVLTQAAVQFDRYLLPTVVAAQLLGGVGLALVVRDVTLTITCRIATARRRSADETASAWRHGAAAYAVMVAILAGATLPGFYAALSCIHQFGDDSRDRMNAWLVENLEGRSFVVADGYAQLDSPGLRAVGHRTGQSTLNFSRYTLDYLRENGVTHVIACNLTYDRYLNEYRRPAPGREDHIARLTAGYRQLFEEGRVVWESRQAVPMPYYVNPRVTIFRIDGQDPGHPPVISTWADRPPE